MTRYQATFTPQAWINDYAEDVDPVGETTWDCTNAVEENQDYFAALFAEAGTHNTVIDREDRVKDDPEAPEWVRAWPGPYTLVVTRPDEQNWHVTYTAMTVTARTSDEAVAKADDGKGGGNWEATPETEVVPMMEGLTQAQRADVAHINGLNVPVTWFIGHVRDNGSREAIALGKDFVWSLLWDEHGTLHTSEAKLGEFSTGIDV